VDARQVFLIMRVVEAEIGDLHARVLARRLIAEDLPASQRALEAAARALFFSLPVAFDPAESPGPYLAVIDRRRRSVMAALLCRSTARSTASANTPQATSARSSLPAGVERRAPARGSVDRMFVEHS
jgi:hypothetical protein